MASITVRKVDDASMERLRIRAAIHGHTLEEEVRRILTRSLVEMTSGADLWSLSRELFNKVNSDVQLTSHQDRGSLELGD